MSLLITFLFIKEMSIMQQIGIIYESLYKPFKNLMKNLMIFLFLICFVHFSTQNR